MEKTIRLTNDNFIKIFAALLLAAAAFVTSPGATGTSRAASQTDERNYEIPVGQFHSFAVDDNVNVVYRCHPDTTGVVHYKGASRFEDAFIFTNSNGNLRIQVNTEDVNDPELPTLYIYSDYLTKAKNGSDFTVTIEGIAPTPKFDAIQIGNGTINIENIKATNVYGKLDTGQGNIVLSGQCDKAKFRIIGTGTIQADRLKSSEVECGIMGSGTIGCWPEKALKTHGLGSTKIYYKGKPEIKKRGGGRLLPLDTTESREIYLPRN